MKFSTLTMINTVLKILATILAGRLQAVCHSLIGSKLCSDVQDYSGNVWSLAIFISVYTPPFPLTDINISSLVAAFRISSVLFEIWCCVGMNMYLSVWLVEWLFQLFKVLH